MEDPDGDTTLEAECSTVQWFNLKQNSRLMDGEASKGKNQKKSLTRQTNQMGGKNQESRETGKVSKVQKGRQCSLTKIHALGKHKKSTGKNTRYYKELAKSEQSTGIYSIYRQQTT